MKDQLELLIALQEVDDRIADLTGRVSGIPERIESLRAGYRKEEQVLEEVKESLEDQSKKRRAEERLLETQDEKIKKFKDQQFLVKTNKEYQTLNHEIELLEQKKSQIEDVILGLMDEAGQVEERIAAQEKKVTAARDIFKSEEKRLSGEQAELEALKAVAEQERAEILESVSPEHARNYARVRESRQGKAVVAAVGGICQGCHMALTPQKFQEVLKKQGIQTCNQCRRILYHREEHVEA